MSRKISICCIPLQCVFTQLMHRNFLLDTGTNANVLLIFFFSSRFWLWIHHNLGCVKKKWFKSIVLDLIGEHFSVFWVCRLVLEQKILFINSFTDLTSENGCKGIFYVALARSVGKFSWIIYLAISLSIFLVWNWKKNYSYFIILKICNHFQIKTVQKLGPLGQHCLNILFRGVFPPIIL